MRDVVVVGSGISGLSAAFRIKKLGYDVAVYEKDDEIGGNIKTLSEKGFTFELGPQTILADEEVLGFFKEVGIKPIEASPSSKNRYIYKRGKLVPLPLNPVSFLLSPLLSPLGKLKVLREPWVPKKENGEESIGEFVRRRFGQEFLDYVVGPFVSGVYAGDPEKLSVKYAVRKVYELEQTYGSVIRGALKKKALGPKGKLVSFEGGLFSLVSKLAQDLEVHKENVVLRIRRKGDRFILDTRGGKVEAKVVVVSSPAYTSSYLLKDLSWSASLEFDKIDYVPLAVVNISAPPQVPDGFGLLVPRREGKRILGIIFSSKLFPKRAPQGRELLTVYIGGATDREVADLSEEEIAQTALKETEEILNIRNVEVLHVKKWKRAIPQYTVGYSKYIDLAQEMEQTHRGLVLTGNYLGGVSVADCIRNSRRVVEKVKGLLAG